MTETTGGGAGGRRRQPAAPEAQPAQEQAEEPRVETGDEGEAPRVSSDARFSTYRQATDDELDTADPVLPPGPHVMQEKGEASEDAEPGFRFENKG